MAVIEERVWDNLILFSADHKVGGTLWNLHLPIAEHFNLFPWSMMFHIFFA
jgi:hypothetical protein